MDKENIGEKQKSALDNLVEIAISIPEERLSSHINFMKTLVKDDSTKQ